MKINQFIFLVLILSVSCKQDKLKPVTSKNVSQSIIEKDTIYNDIIAILSPEGSVSWTKDTIVVNSASRQRNENSQTIPDYVNTIKGYPDVDTIVGDFNGDGKKEKAWFKYRKGEKHYNIDREKLTQKELAKIPDSLIVELDDNELLFSDKSIKPLKIKYIKYDWVLKNEGDLNDDGKDEIGILPGWGTSACRNYKVFTYKKNRWKMICYIGSTLNMRAKGFVVIEKDKSRKGYAIIRESVENYIWSHPKHKIPAEFTNSNCCTRSNVMEYSLKLK